jgi:homoserine kinase
VYPELPRLLAAARDAGALGAFLAGAGSTIAALVHTTDEVAADRVGAALRATAASLHQPGRLQAIELRSGGARTRPSR